MRLLLSNHVRNARDSLRSNRSRTLLTVAGITLGVACMTTILALSGGASKLIDDQVNTLDGNIAVVRPGGERKITSVRDLTDSAGYGDFATAPLSEEDLEAVKKIPHVSSVAPLMSINGSVQSKSEKLQNVSIVATTPEFAKISQLEIRDGQFIDNVTNNGTAVIGQQLSIDLFGTEQSVGQTFKVRGQQFTVIGILKPVSDSVNYNNLDVNNSVVISIESGKAFNRGIAQIRQINIKADQPSSLADITKKARVAIEKTHGGEQDFTILTGEDISKPTSRFFSAIGFGAGVVAIVSLVIGGIGIMNIMLVNVAERTREIGIRKAVGASNTHIIMQFLIESLSMSVLGGIFGYVIGYGTAFVVSTYLPFSPAINIETAITALIISVGVGTLFGLYPALRAARKNPITALRQYH